MKKILALSSALLTILYAPLSVAAPAVTVTGPNGKQAGVDNLGNFQVNCVTGCAAGSNTSVGPTGAAAPSFATEVGWVDGSLNLQHVSAAQPFPVADASVVAAINSPIPPGTNLIGYLGGDGTAASPSTHAITAQGVQTQGQAVAGGVTRFGCRAANQAPIAVTDGAAVDPQCGLEGKQIILPYAIKELMVRGYATDSTGTQHSIIASAGVGLKNYITNVQCYNTSATTVTVAFTDVATGGPTSIIVPAGAGNNVVYSTPLVTAAATAFQFTPSANVGATVGCAAQGYTGP